MKIRAFLPSWRSLPDITHHTLKSLSCVPKRADATIPVSIIGAGLGLPLRPSKKRKQKNKTGQWKLVLLVKSSITPAIKKNHYKGTRTRDPLGCRLSQIQCMMEKNEPFNGAHWPPWNQSAGAMHPAGEHLHPLAGRSLLYTSSSQAFHYEGKTEKNNHLTSWDSFCLPWYAYFFVLLLLLL